MIKALSTICILSFLGWSFAVSAAVNADKKNDLERHQNTQQSPENVISINLTDENDGWEDSDAPLVTSEPENSIDNEDPYEQAQAEHTLSSSESESNTTKPLDFVSETTDAWNNKLPGEEIHYQLHEYSNSNYLIDGKADSDIGKLRYQSRLMPSNEVKLSIKLKQKEIDDIELIAYFDLANFTMELDGNKAILNKSHKQLLSVSSAHLQANYEQIYKDVDFPEHALMLVQMMSYWSVSPEGYQHAKRQIVSKH